MKLPIKVILAILVVFAVAGGALWNQSCTSGPKTVKLSAHDMEVVFQELLPPAQQQQIAASEEEKKKLVGELKKLLALAQAAEQEGYLQRPELASQVALESDLTLARAYRKSNPDVKVADDEINAYHTAHPKEFEEFIQGSPRLQQAQDAQRDVIKKQYGELKVLVEHARKDKIDQEDLTRIKVLIDRSQALAGAYKTDLQKNSDKLFSDGDVEQYFSDHTSEFDEVRVRHILISTQPAPAGEDEGEGDKNKKDTPKPLTKEEAKKKATALLERARKGEDFAKLAKENSDDPGSKDKGGESDFFGRGRMGLPEFEEAAFKLKPGEISEPVETQLGYHIIQLEERRSATSASDPKIRQQITEKLKQENLDARIDEITAASTVEVAENFDTTPKQAPALTAPSTGQTEKQ